MYIFLIDLRNMVQEYCVVKSEALVDQDRQLASPKIERKIIHDNGLQHSSISYLEVKQQEDFLERVAFLNNIRYVFVFLCNLFSFISVYCWSFLCF